MSELVQKSPDKNLPASNTEYLQRLTKNLNTNSNVHVGYVAMPFETINTIVSLNAIAAVVSSIITIDQSSSHARMFPKMFVRISERLTKSFNRRLIKFSMRCASR